MKNFFVRLISCFIFNKNKRKKFRQKHLTPTVKDIFYIVEDMKKNIDNINFKQNLIMDYYFDAKGARPASGQLRNFQMECFGLLKEFKRVCDKYKLEYWLDFGSLLGAVRHGGFVPWDDDLDVSMPKSSFEKFRTIAQDVVSDNIVFVDWVPGRMARFKLKENSLGAFLDIYCYEEGEGELHTTLPFVNLHSRNPVAREILLPTKNVKFEGLTVSAPNNIDYYLRIRYGNYIQLPKKSNLEIGHTKISEYLK